MHSFNASLFIFQIVSTALFEYETAIYSRLHKIWTVYGWKLKNYWYTAKFRQWINSIPHLSPISTQNFNPIRFCWDLSCWNSKSIYFSSISKWKNLARVNRFWVSATQIPTESDRIEILGGDGREMRDRVDSLSEFRCISAILQLSAVYSSDFM